MSENGNSTFDLLLKLPAKGLPNCLIQRIHFRSMIVGSLEITEIRTGDRPEPTVAENPWKFVEKKMCHVDIIFQVVYLGRFSVMADFAEIEGAIH